MNTFSTPGWDGTERRQTASSRRAADRRSYTERRYDSRQTRNPNRNFYGWVRSLTRARLGVDRRKHGEQRIVGNRRSSRPCSILTREEIADLLS